MLSALARKKLSGKIGMIGRLDESLQMHLLVLNGFSLAKDRKVAGSRHPGACSNAAGLSYPFSDIGKMTRVLLGHISKAFTAS